MLSSYPPLLNVTCTTSSELHWITIIQHQFLDFFFCLTGFNNYVWSRSSKFVITCRLRTQKRNSHLFQFREILQNCIFVSGRDMFELSFVNTLPQRKYIYQKFLMRSLFNRLPASVIWLLKSPVFSSASCYSFLCVIVTVHILLEKKLLGQVVEHFQYKKIEC